LQRHGARGVGGEREREGVRVGAQLLHQPLLGNGRSVTCGNLRQRSSTWGALPSGDKRKVLTTTKPKRSDRFDLESALIVAVRNIRPRAEVLACQKEAQSPH
jgi:hypothetical protein